MSQIPGDHSEMSTLLKTLPDEPIQPIQPIQPMLPMLPIGDDGAPPGPSLLPILRPPLSGSPKVRAKADAGAALGPEGAWTEASTQSDVLGFSSRYASKGPLGEGGMAEVSVLRDEWIGRDVAGKFLHPRFQNVAGVRARFMREACLQGRLEHPSIVPVHDVGVADGRPYFTMKRIRGMTLREVLEGLRSQDREFTARFSRRKLLTAFSNVCLCIAFAHEHGVIHRDLKPANVMLGDFGETYVLDWGIAKLIGTSETGFSSDVLLDRKDRTIFGTPGYMAPEQITAPHAALGVAADIYALGALLFEILTYERLNPHKTSAELLRVALQGVDARASVRCPERDVPPELEAICVRATARDPGDRFSSARELNDALERFLDGERDTTLRRELANAHLLAAEAADVEAQGAEPEQQERYRSVAINSLGRALAFDADNARAMERLVDLLLQPPSFVPRDAAEAVQTTLLQGQRIAFKTIIASSILMIPAIPLMLMMGVRDWVGFAAIAVGLFSVLVVQMCYLRAERPSRWLPYVSVLIGALSIGLASRTFGGFFSVNLLLVYLVPISVSADRGLRIFGFVLCTLFTLGPSTLEMLGILSQSYAFEDGKLIVLPNLVNFPPLPTTLMAIGTNVVFLWIIGFGVNHFRDMMQTTEERNQLFAWQLRQLLPRKSPLAHSFSCARVAPAAAGS